MSNTTRNGISSDDLRRLAREMMGGAENDIVTFRDHPSYGRTIKDITSKIDMAEGMIRAALVWEGELHHVHNPARLIHWDEDASRLDHIRTHLNIAARQRRDRATVRSE